MLEAVIFYTVYVTDVNPESIAQGYFWNSKYAWTMEYCEEHVLPEFKANLETKEHIHVKTLECEYREVIRQGE